MGRYPNGLPSVTECLNQEAKPKLEAWKLKRAMQAYDNGYKKGKAIELALAVVEVEEADDAAIGTWLHECAANRLIGEPVLPFMDNARSQCANLLINLDKFLDEVSALEPISIETPVFGSFEQGDRVVEYAGTPDAIVMHQGEVTLIDFKSSRTLHANYAAQLAAYMYAWNQANPEQKITKPWLVQVSKTTPDEYGIKRISASELKLGWTRFQSCATLWYLNSGKWGVTLDW